MKGGWVGAVPVGGEAGGAEGRVGELGVEGRGCAGSLSAGLPEEAVLSPTEPGRESRVIGRRGPWRSMSGLHAVWGGALKARALPGAGECRNAERRGHGRVVAEPGASPPVFRTVSREPQTGAEPGRTRADRSTGALCTVAALGPRPRPRTSGTRRTM